jgi:17beta-estradiol 17-dehydrogenase / very-long-chain 3-oxoacyl-CoA reductase
MSQYKKWLFRGLVGYGILRSTFFILSQAKNLFVRFQRSLQSLHSVYSKSSETNSWAVVTGATGGLGAQFSHQLAKEKFNLVLLARRKQELETFGEELRKTYNIEVKIVVIDFNLADNAGIWDKVRSALDGLDIAILVNNIGAYDWCPLEAQQESKIEQLLNINVFTPTMMTRTIIPTMINRKRRSAVIFVGSFSGEALLPYTAVNGASKKYVHYLAQCLASEYFDKRIDFLGVVAGFIQTPGLEDFSTGKPILVSKASDIAKGVLSDVKIADQIDNISYGTFKGYLLITLLKNPLTRRYFRNRIALKNVV